MRWRWSIGGLVLLGLLAAVSAALLVASSGGHLNRPALPVEILVAAKALPPLTVIDAGMVNQMKVTKKEAPAGYYTNAVQVVGKMLIVPVANGQVLTPDCFGDRDSRAKAAAAIPPGKVAVSISLKDYSRLEGLLYPGSLVDVIFISNQRDNQQPISGPLLQAVEVWAIGQLTVISPKHEAAGVAPPRSGESLPVTLLLTSKEAEKVYLATAIGTLSLAMRNPTIPAAPDTKTLSIDDLWTEKAKTADPAQPLPPGTAPPGWVMEVIQGGKKELIPLPKPGEW